MSAECSSSATFQAAFDALDEGHQLEVDFAIYALEDDPAWDGVLRCLAPADSPYHGFLIDFSVDEYGIVYRIVDRGACVELWYLLEIPGSKVRRPRSPDDQYPPFM